MRQASGFLHQGAAARTASTTQQFSTNLGVALFVACISAVGTIAVARLLGPVGTGEVAAVTAWLPLLALLAQAGQPELAVLAAVTEGPTKQLDDSALTNTFWAGTIVSICAFVLLPVPLLHRLAAVVFVLCASASSVLVARVQGLQLWRTWNLLRGIIPTLTTIGVLVLAAIGLAEPAALLFAYSTAAAIALAVVVRKVQARVSARPSLQGLMAGAPLTLSNLLKEANGRLDFLAVVVLGTAQEAGLYAVAFSVLGATSLAAFTGSQLALTLGDNEDRRRIQIRHASTALGALAGAGMVVAAALTPLIFGKSFAPAQLVMLILAIGVAVNPRAGVNVAFLKVRRRFQAAAAVDLIGAGITCVGSLLLYPVARLPGIAAASSAGFLAAAAVSEILTRHAPAPTHVAVEA